MVLSDFPWSKLRIIHLKSGGFQTVNVIDGDESAATDGLSVQLDQASPRVV